MAEPEIQKSDAHWSLPCRFALPEMTGPLSNLFQGQHGPVKASKAVERMESAFGHGGAGSSLAFPPNLTPGCLRGGWGTLFVR